MIHWEGQMKEKADVQDKLCVMCMCIYCTCGVTQLESMLHRHVSWSNHLSDLQTISGWLLLNLHLIKVRTPCTFSNKLPIISKPYWFIPCFLYLCCIAHHTFYTSEHHFLPLHKYQYCMSERRSRGPSPRSCLEKQGYKGHWNTRGMHWGLHRHFSTRKKKGFWTFGILSKVQALIINSHKHPLKVDRHAMLSPLYREGNGHRRIKQHCQGQAVQQCHNRDQYAAPLIPHLHSLFQAKGQAGQQYPPQKGISVL